MARLKEEVATMAENGHAMSVDAMEQVRELLFGETKRSTDQNLKSIDDKIEAMRADFQAQVSALETRLVELSCDTERTHLASIDAIGGAIAQLGATIQNMGARRKGG